MKISLVVPVFNEEDTIHLFCTAVFNCSCLSKHEIEIVFVNDGSADRTEKILEEIAQENKNIVVVTFSRNFGKEAALMAGLSFSSGDVVIPMDVDLQDPIEVIPDLLKKHQEGFEVVLAKRVDRKEDGLLKRLTSDWFYRVHNKISETKIENNVGDFRLISRKAVDAIIALPEKKLFMKGVLSWVGFSTTVVTYKRPRRVSGKTKFTAWKLWNLALEGITSFSTWPLRVWTYIGLIIALASFIYGCCIIFQKIFFGNSVPGYSSLISAILFLGGVQLIGIGILGEYIGRVYIETKNRPRYVVKTTINTSKTVKPLVLS